jgi:hypothetical protein
MIGSLRVTLLVIGLIAEAAAAEPIAASRGTWVGAIGGSAGWPSGAGKVELRVDGTDKRFSVTLAGPGGPLLDQAFQAGSRKDVFDPPPAGGMLSFLRGGSPANPLEGKPLSWARRAGEELVVYRLEVQDGPFRLDRLALKPAGDRVEVAFERRAHDRAPERFQTTLERQKP